MDADVTDADNRLRLLHPTLDEAVTRSNELSVQAESVDDLGGLGHDIDNVVTEMEALRQALEETNPRSASAAAASELPPPPTSAPPPPDRPDATPSTGTA
jgi:hypothetical protein